MRKIETEMLEAIRNGSNFSSSNTVVIKFHYYNSTVGHSLDIPSALVYLHGNHIATVTQGSVRVNIDTLRKYPTVTTKSRLRALGVNVCTKKGITYLYGEAI